MLPLINRPALWLLPVFWLVAAIYVASYTEIDTLLGNAQAAMSAGSTTLLFSCLLAALTAAVESSRDRISRGVVEVSSRNYLSRVLVRIWPSIAAGLLIQFSVVAYLLARAGALIPVQLWLVPVGFALAITAHACFGYFLGQWLPARFSVPSALMLSYLFLAFTGTSSIFAVHYLSGMTLNGCCMAVQNLDYRAVWTLITFSTFAAVGFLTLARLKCPIGKGKTRSTNRQANYWSGLVFLVLAVVMGLLISAKVEGIPIVEADAAEFSCSVTDPQVCLNEVQRFNGDRSELVARSVSVLRKLGFPDVNKVTASLDEDLRVEDSRELMTNFEPWYSDEQVVYASASAYAAEVLNHLCESGNFDKQYEAFEVMQEWSTIYVSHEILGTDEKFSNSALNSMSFEQQKNWALATYESLANCETPPMPEVAP